MASILIAARFKAEPRRSCTTCHAALALGIQCAFPSQAELACLAMPWIKAGGLFPGRFGGVTLLASLARNGLATHRTAFDQPVQPSREPNSQSLSTCRARSTLMLRVDELATVSP